MGITDPNQEVSLPFLAKSVEKCANCPANSNGLYCEKCKDSFYGNPILGQQCKPCPCPGLFDSASSYHAKGCNLDQSTSKLICQVNISKIQLI